MRSRFIALALLSMCAFVTTITHPGATNGRDYTLADGTLNFGAGQRSRPIAVLIHNDSDVEANRTVVVTLSSVTATLGANRVTTLTILDDE
jgi:Calx-beta domain